MDKKTILNELNKIFIDDISEKIVDKVIFTPKTKEELQEAVDLWCKDRIQGEKKYGNINTWDTSLITDMSNLFKECYNFNDDIYNTEFPNYNRRSNFHTPPESIREQRRNAPYLRRRPSFAFPLNDET